jgi:ABC-type multidrug transport system ATPase subunit
MISVQNLQHAYSKKRGNILQIETLELAQQGLTAILGPNGSGKSTLLACLAGQMQPQRGSVRYQNLNTWRNFEAIKRDIHLIALEVALFDRLSAKEHIKLIKEVAYSWSHELEDELLADLKIPLDEPISTLSRGELAKLKILLSLCQSPKVILIDEITNDLDTRTRKLIFRKLDSYSFDHDAHVLIATNIIFDMERIANQIILLKEGQVVLQDEIDHLKERYKKILLKSTPLYQGQSITHLQHDRLEWNGTTGILMTSRYDPQITTTLNEMGIETYLDSYPLEEIITHVGGV